MLSCSHDPGLFIILLFTNKSINLSRNYRIIVLIALIICSSHVQKYSSTRTLLLNYNSFSYLFYDQENDFIIIEYE